MISFWFSSEGVVFWQLYDRSMNSYDMVAELEEVKNNLPSSIPKPYILFDNAKPHKVIFLLCFLIILFYRLIS